MNELQILEAGNRLDALENELARMGTEIAELRAQIAANMDEGNIGEAKMVAAVDVGIKVNRAEEQAG